MKLHDVTIKEGSAVIALLAAIAFGVLGCVTDPIGIIDRSMLYLVAQFLIFAATALGMGATIQKMSNLVKEIKK